MRKMETAELTKESDSIVMGTVTKIASLYDRGFFTDVTIMAEQFIKGNVTPEITVRIPGGEINGVSLKVSDTPIFNQGERVILFIKKSKVGNYNIVEGLHQGKLTIDKNNSVIEKSLPLDTVIQEIKTNIKPAPILNPEVAQ